MAARRGSSVVNNSECSYSLNWRRLINMKQLLLFLCLLISVVETKAEIRILIVDGFSNHDWMHTTQSIKAILERTSEFSVSISTYPSGGSDAELAAWNPEFSDYDVVIQSCNDIGGGPKWPRRVEKALEEYVSEGGGLYVFHSANNAFAHWEAYNRMIGLGWRGINFGWAICVGNEGEIARIPAGAGEKTSHGPRVDALLTRLGDHPIHAGLPRQWRAADIEIYRYARGPAENLNVLSFAQDEKTGINFPIEWTVQFGNGRVYNSTMGHVWHGQNEPEGMRCAGLQTLMPRIIQWLSGQDVTQEVPEDFPTAGSVRLRNHPVGK
jgi:type 1 glutamine amidotransferase